MEDRHLEGMVEDVVDRLEAWMQPGQLDFFDVRQAFRNALLDLVKEVSAINPDSNHP